MQRLGYSSGVVVVNDALIALVAGAGNEPGIAIISGTGSIAYGRNARNVAARAGGWGHIIGDEGSRYWIGREALAAVVRMIDGRGPETSLTEGVLAHFSIDDPSELARIVYDRDFPRMNVAALGPVVQRARDRGDEVATRLLDRAADELTAAAGSVASRLGMRDDTFPFVLAGGVFRAVPWMAKELPRRLGVVAPHSHVVLLEAEPAVGAVTLALAELNGGARLPLYGPH
jgi:N-acetylglucosamine kinase-like BadF-type ATPase